MTGATRLTAVEQQLGHRFADPELLIQACTHSSYSQETDSSLDNERMEFLGDAVLGAAVAWRLFDRHREVDEGALSRNKSHLVSRQVLAETLEATGLLEHCRIGRQMQGPLPVSVKANLAEAILGAVFIDGGWEALQQAVDGLLGDRLQAEPARPQADHKSALQQYSLANSGELPQYQTERIGGSDHQPIFKSTVGVGDQEASAEASSRRKAEAAAAEQLLAKLEQDP